MSEKERIVRRGLWMLAVLMVVLLVGMFLPITVLDSRGKIALFSGWLLGALTVICIAAIMDAQGEL